MQKISITIENPSAALLAILLNSGALSGGVSVVASGQDEDDTPPNAGAVIPALDSAGIPWDERIHAASKAIVANGTWRKKKGADAAYVATVESDLRAKLATVAAAMPQPPVAAPAAPAMPSLQMPANPNGAPADYQQPAAPLMPSSALLPHNPAAFVPVMPTNPEPVAAPVMPQPAAAPATVQPVPQAAAEIDFQGLMALIQNLMKTPSATPGVMLVTPDYLQTFCQRITAAYSQTATPVQINSLTDMLQHPFVCPYAVQILRADGKIS